MNVSIVSISLVACPPQTGQTVSLNVGDVVIGDFPTTEKSTSFGNNTGS